MQYLCNFGTTIFILKTRGMASLAPQEWYFFSSFVQISRFLEPDEGLVNPAKDTESAEDRISWPKR